MSDALFDTESIGLVLKRMADGRYHSGEELGELLGVSRAAVWKVLKKFEQLGVSVLSIKGKGYCVDGGLDILDINRISPQIPSTLQIKLFNQIDSTNTYLLRSRSPSRAVCIAESQTAGRGRRGRHWVTPFAKNICFSIAWQFEGGIAALEGLSLVVGVLVVRVLRRIGIDGIKLKWPNDILYRNKKLGGVLIEISGDPLGECMAVIGLGLNISVPDSSAAAIEQPWINLNEIFFESNLSPVGRNELIASLLTEIAEALATYQHDRLLAYRDEWLTYAAYLGNLIQLDVGGVQYEGILKGINQAGAVIIQIDDLEHAFHGGEISLRAMNVS